MADAEGDTIPATSDSVREVTAVPRLRPSTPAPTPTSNPQAGQLGARPSSAPAASERASGTQRLGLVEDRNALLYVPQGYRAEQPAPLVLVLHGAGGNAEAGLALLQPLADVSNVVLLAPAARRETWDVIIDEYGPDVELIDRALAETFSRYTIDPQRLAIGGFSDGASYALSLGLTNGNLFTDVIAFSPGFMSPRQPIGQPRIFISHGIHDDVLLIDRCSRRIVPQLQRAGYDVRYREFSGPHTIPPEIASEALDWFTLQRDTAGPTGEVTP